MLAPTPSQPFLRVRDCGANTSRTPWISTRPSDQVRIAASGHRGPLACLLTSATACTCAMPELGPEIAITA